MVINMIRKLLSTFALFHTSTSLAGARACWAGGRRSSGRRRCWGRRRRHWGAAIRVVTGL